MTVVLDAEAGDYLENSSQMSERWVNTLVGFASFEGIVAMRPWLEGKRFEWCRKRTS